MKKLILILCLLSISLDVNAQENKVNEGKFFINGSVGVNISGPYKLDALVYIPFENDNPVLSSSEVGSEFFYINASVRGGYFFTENFVAGLSIDYFFDKSSIGGNIASEPTVEKKHNYLVSPFMRYYFRNKIFLQSQVGLGKQYYRIKASGYNPFFNNYFNFDNTVNNSIEILGIGVGYNYKIGNNIYFEPLFSYNIITGKEKLNSGGTDFHTNRLYVNLGVLYKFN